MDDNRPGLLHSRGLHLTRALVRAIRGPCDLVYKIPLLVRAFGLRLKAARKSARDDRVSCIQHVTNYLELKNQPVKAILLLVIQL